MRSLLLLPLLLLTACEGGADFHGTLSLKSALTVQTGGGTATLAPGRYTARIAMGEGGGTVSVGNVSFGLPAIQPDANGRVQVSAGQLGQSFGLSGRVTTARGPVDKVITRSCLYDTRREYVCDSGVDDESCWQERPVYGTEEVRVRGGWSQRSIQMQVVKGGRVAGTFSATQRAGERTENEEVLSSCFPN